MFSKLWDGLNVMNRRAMIMGATMPPGERWKLYVAALSGPALIAIFATNNLMEPDPQHWRVYLGWGLIGACLFLMPFTLTMLYSHHRRDKIAPELIDSRYKRAFDLGRNFRIGMLAAFTVPPLLRLILRLFGYEF